jgi:hypothetical protein
MGAPNTTSNPDTYRVRRRYQYDVQSYESVTVAGTAIGFTAGTIRPSSGGDMKRAIVTVETAQVRFRADGTAPTASEGHILNPGDTLVIGDYATLSNFKAIRTGGVSGVLKVSYET